MKIAHNVSIVTQFNPEMECYTHAFCAVVSDVNEGELVGASQQFNMSVLTALEADKFVIALREMADKIEEFESEA